VFSEPAQSGHSRRQTGLIVGLVITVVVLIAVAVSIGFTIGTRASQPHAASTSTPGPHDGDMRRFLMPIPAGAKAVADPVGIDGTITMAQDASVSDSTSGRIGLLVADNFQAEVGRQWQGPEGRIDIRLIRTATAVDARHLFDDETYSMRVKGTSTGTPAGGVDAGCSYVGSWVLRGVSETVSLGVKGDVVIEIFTRQPGRVDPTVGPKALVEECSRL